MSIIPDTCGKLALHKIQEKKKLPHAHQACRNAQRITTRSHRLDNLLLYSARIVLYSCSPRRISKSNNLCIRVEETVARNCAQFNAWCLRHTEART